LAKNYIDINIVKITNSPTDICIGCNGNLNDVAVNEDGLKICNNCQTEHSVILYNKTSKDASHISNTSTQIDDSIDNFMQAFDRYSGIQSEPADFIYRELDSYFTKYNLPTKNQTKNIPKDRRGHKLGTSQKLMAAALNELGRSEFYQDIQLLCHKYWGWDLPDVQKLRSNMIDIYNKTQIVFYEIPISERNRTSSLGTQFRLFKQLQLLGHECYEEEFRIAENETSYNLHHKLWKMMCDGANDSNIYYIV